MSDGWNQVRSTGRAAAPGRLLRRLVEIVLLVGWVSGCAALHPIHGVPASYLPCEFAGPSRDGLRPINPMLLTRSRPPEHLVDAGDVLAVYIPGILGVATTEGPTIGEIPPINFPTDPEMPPTIGFPVSVRGDGTLSLPQIPPIPVRGLTLSQVEQAVRHAYSHPQQILAVGKERVLVSLQRPRDYRVLVVREDAAPTAEVSGLGMINIGNSRRGTARIVSLKAYENDVLHALARTIGADGLPGLDAEGAVYVIRRNARGFDAGDPAGSAWEAPLPSYAPAVNPYGRPPQGPGGGWPRSAATSGTVIRGQSPNADYRRSATTGYSGHSFTAASPVTAGAGGALVRPETGHAPATTTGHAAGSAYLAPPPATSGRYAAPPIANAAPSAPMTMSQTDGWTAAPPPATSSRYPGQPHGTLPLAASSPASVRSRPVLPAGGYPPGMTPTAPGIVDPLWPAGPAFPAPYGANGPVFGSPSAVSPAVAAPYWPPPHQPVPAAPAFDPGPLAGVGAPVASPAPRWGDEVERYFGAVRHQGLDPTIDGPQIIRIPIRVAPGEVPHIRERDIILEDGDIVFIEARHSEVFYTGGLLGGGQYTLPRDYDLHALEAVSIAQAMGGIGGGRMTSSGGVSALNQDVTISASKLIVVRRLVDGTRVPIEVDLNRAKRDMTGRENIIIQPGDYLYLQYSCVEAIGAFFERHLLEGALFGVAGAALTTGGTR